MGLKINYNHIVIIAFAVLIHGLLLLNDGIYWDGWLNYFRAVERDWNSLCVHYTETGDPLKLIFHWFMWFFPGTIFGYKLVSFGSITFSALLVYMIFAELKVFSSSEALFIALLSLAYPGFQAAIQRVVTPYLFCYGLFLLAFLFALRSEKMTGGRHWCLRMGALALFALSFGTYSLLVFYGGFFLVLIWYSSREQHLLLKQYVTKILPRRLDYVLLPLIFWIFKKQLYPESGLYTGYNQFTLTIPSLVFYFNEYFHQAVVGQFREAWNVLSAHPVILLLIFPAAYGVYHVCKMERNPFFSTGLKSIHWLIMGLILLACGIFPYAAVGAIPSLHGWSTRYALLCGLPMALIIMGITKLIFSKKNGVINRFGFMFLSFIIIAFILANNHNYIAWQARWVKDRSIITNLSKMSIADNISVFWVADDFPVIEEHYWFYEWASMFKQAWSNESHLGLSGCFSPKVVPNSLYSYSTLSDRGVSLAAFNPGGAQAILTIRPGLQMEDNYSLVRQYFKCRFFRPELMNDFLTGVTRLHIDITPREGPGGPDGKKR